MCEYKMIKTISISWHIGFRLWLLLLSQAVIANDDFTQDEANTIVKEDIASAQVMAEVCPAIDW